ncbi:MAG: nucleoside 2-deoxyribosyltransferase domain-containing protein [Anaerolineales bacterium]|nr:nucleoside 2-deoxyribosyltransferase domain-containing protein [Anaerolineales bacterium]
MSLVLKPPTSLSHITTSRTVFLAGSIEMGTAEDWQTRVTSALQTIPDLTILNPRRDEWDGSWEQTIANPVFREQVEWELDAQDLATLIVMYFSPATKAPITLLELGLFAASDKLIVCCPDGYWRKGNVEVVCDRYEIPLVDTLDELIAAVRRRF